MTTMTWGTASWPLSNSLEPSQLPRLASALHLDPLSFRTRASPGGTLQHAVGCSSVDCDNKGNKGLNLHACYHVPIKCAPCECGPQWRISATHPRAEVTSASRRRKTCHRATLGIFLGWGHVRGVSRARGGCERRSGSAYVACTRVVRLQNPPLTSQRGQLRARNLRQLGDTVKLVEGVAADKQRRLPGRFESGGLRLRAGSRLPLTGPPSSSPPGARRCTQPARALG